MTERLSADQAMERAVSLAALGPEHGPNPRVGAVITAADGAVLGEGFHRGAGTPHAEVAAIAAAQATGQSLEGATAYVTLEPCHHTGRTGPCTRALADVGIARVVFAVPDPNPVATGGAAWLQSRGIEVAYAANDGAYRLNARWLRAMTLARPYVIAKWAQTLDGYIAAADGTSVWITGDQARDHAHHVRAAVDALLVGTGTVIADNPALSARPAGVANPHQPLRVVMGHRPTPDAQVWRDEGALHLDTHSPREALDALWSREVRSLVVEGGATVVSAFLRAGLVDELNVYVAPALLGDGMRAVSGLGIGTMSQALRGRAATATALGVDTLVTALLGKE